VFWLPEFQPPLAAPRLIVRERLHPCRVCVPVTHALLGNILRQSTAHPATVSPQLQVPSPHTAADVPAWQTPADEHASPVVHTFPSSHDRPAKGVTVHVDVPLHVRSLQLSEAQLTAVPAQRPPKQISLCEHAFPSSHPVAVRQAQTPPALLHT
jgi:hypothetical protein